MTVFVTALLTVFMGFTVSVSNGFKPFDCSDVYKSGQTVSGIYSIYPAGDVPVWVYCEMVSDGKVEDKGQWTVIQRRMDGSVNFYQPWNQYKRGFGNVEGEYWLGLENMYQLTRNRTSLEGKVLLCTRSSLWVQKLAGDSMSFNDGMKFTTLDKDQDLFGKNCAKLFLGAFWYKDCHYANPNGVYLWGEDPTIFAIGNVWYTWKNSHAVGMKFISMKIKPAP
ncbi:hypothetical protein Q8A67_005384 [Cirrhinus molitorella]|uniref:Fibrinogen C-terminal domain-containing protein n=1 Tax=Cirrhinus molitorella TaxID=172907 RepID=A0AA88QEC3_9TELE|nr:hypothetical protein Q8A67_005384 [Cirrhinus molitorella]